MAKEKVVLITGASSGIGAMTAKILVQNGHKVILTARRKKKLDELVDYLGEDHAVAAQADATQIDELTQVVQ